VEKQSPGAVGVYRERRWSAMDTAVEAAEERPHFLISAPPRLATCKGEVARTTSDNGELRTQSGHCAKCNVVPGGRLSPAWQVAVRQQVKRPP
jgi:hypothetical protein